MKFGTRVVVWASGHANCSVHHNQGLYLESVAPAIDRGSDRGRRYFLAGPSTCALYVCRAWGDCEAGLDDPELHDIELTMSYVDEIGTAVENIQKVAARRGALEQGTPSHERVIATAPDGHTTFSGGPFEAGDVVIIDGPPYGVHCVLIMEDATVLPDGSWSCAINQGGQSDGGVVATGVANGQIDAIDVRWHWRDGKLFAGDGARNVIAVCRARAMDLDLSDRKVADKTSDTEPAPTMPTSGHGAADE